MGIFIVADRFQNNITVSPAIRINVSRFQYMARYTYHILFYLVILIGLDKHTIQIF
jgi:hypothetical protein